MYTRKVLLQQNYGVKLRDVKQHCRNLKNISLEGEEYEEKASIATLLASYGGQLEYALLYEMDEVHLKEVSDACPTARFHLETGDMDRLFTGLNMLGPRLEVIYIQYFEITETVDGWKNAWSNATSLRKLYIKGSKSGDVEAIFSTPKEHLKELVLPIPHDTDAGEEKKLMDVVAKGTKCVEAFSVFGFNFYRNSVKDFLEQNKYSLSSIVVRGKFRERDEKLDELLDAFLELPALEIVSVNYAIPDDTLKAIEKRGVHLKRTAPWY